MKTRSLLLPASVKAAPTAYTLFRPYLILFAAHLFTAQAAYYIYYGSTPAIIWPAAGIALAGLVIGGRELWPAITVASLVNSIITGQPGGLALAIAAGSTAQAYAGALLLERFGFDLWLSRLRDAVIFITVTAITSMIGPFIITSGLYVLNLIPLSVFLDTFGRWWLGALIGFMIVGGFILRWSMRPAHYARSKREWWEAGGALLGVCTVAFLITWTPLSSVLGISLVYVLLAPFFWISFRVGPRIMTLAILAMTIIFLTGVAWGWSGSERQLADLIISAESLSVVFAVIFLFLVSANEERKEALRSYANQIDQLEGIVKKVRADERTKTEFLAILAHELRNPLSPLLSSIELLRFKGANREERIKILTAMEERVNTMNSLLDDLLDISRITRKKLKLSRQVIDVSSIAKRAIASIDPLFENKEHSLHVAVPKEPFYVYVDPLRLEQIIVNLLTNAAKYTDEGGDILFSLRRRGEEMEIHVKDNGIGISPNVIRLIFEPFIQLNQSVNRSGSGLGIGLSLTKRLVELHGGRITAESRGKDMGTEFIVRIPAPQAVQLPMPKTEGEKAVVAKATTATQMRVLVVDDNEAAAEGIEELLKIKGYEVAVAFNGKDALRAVQRFDPRAIVLDIGLPDMSGHEVAKTLRLNGSKAFLIALSGYGQEEDKLKARESGFDRHLTKPAGINALERELKEAYAMLPHGPDNHRQAEQQLVGARPAT